MRLHPNSDLDFAIYTFTDRDCDNKGYNGEIVMIRMCKEIYEMTDDDRWWRNICDLGDLDNGLILRVI